MPSFGCRALIPHPRTGFRHPLGMRYQAAGIRARIPRRCQAAICLLALASIAWTARATDSGIGEAPPSSSASASVQRLIVVGFVGGLVRHDDGRHPEVQLAERIHAAYADHVETQVFENRHKRKAHRAIVALLDSDHDGSLSEYEKRSAAIILFGHSWGASAAVGLARDLEREGIPVRLIVEVDSIARIGENDSVIPANVAQAVNFFQTRGIAQANATTTRGTIAIFSGGTYRSNATLVCGRGSKPLFASN